MAALPSLGSRVSIRYRLPAGSVPPLRDVIGHLEERAALIRVRTKSGELIEIPSDAIVAVRELSHAPVRASEIRAIEHAAAFAWPGTEHQWVEGWLLRAGSGYTSRANSAVPLDFSANLTALPAIGGWYAQRGLTPLLAVPDRLLRISALGTKHTRVLTRDLLGAEAEAAAVGFTGYPDAHWLALYGRDVPAEVLTALVDGDVTFASVAGAAVARGAVTAAPDGTRWLGISAVHTAADQRRRGHARTLCAALLGWGVAHGATKAYVQVLVENTAAGTLYESAGFRLHHEHRYVDARSLLPTL